MILGTAGIYSYWDDIVHYVSENPMAVPAVAAVIFLGGSAALMIAILLNQVFQLPFSQRRSFLI